MDTEVIKDSENMSSTLKMPFTPKSFLKKKLKTEKMFLDVTTWKEMEERIHPKRRVLVSNLLHDREAVMLYSPKYSENFSGKKSFIQSFINF